MSNIAIMKNAKTLVSKTGFKLSQRSPEILVVAGVAGVITSAVMACRASMKVNDILAESKETIDTIHKVAEDKPEKYSQEDAKKDLAIAYVQTGVKFAKLYAPSVILGALSITSILASNNILRKRNVALAAAYTAIDKSFKEYRGRVVERFGKEVDRQLKYNIKAEKIEEIVKDPETGKEKKVKRTIEVMDNPDHSEFAKFFDDGCTGWEKDAQLNLAFLRAQQQHANDLLVSQGYLFLNDVYDMLGILRTRAGQVVGWIYDPENPKHNGDNYVDFGIYDVHRRGSRDFVNGYERAILLDFNVDGVILDKLK